MFLTVFVLCKGGVGTEGGGRMKTRE